MKNRSFFVTLAVGVVGLLLVAAASLNFILQQSPLRLLPGGVAAEPLAAIFVPKQAPVMVSLLVNPDRLESFARYIASPAKRRQTHREIASVEASLLAKTGLDYKTEIRPWLGEEITLAVTSLDFDRRPENGSQPGYLLAVNAKDGERAREFLQAAYSKQAIAGTVELTFESDRGVTVIYQRPLQIQDHSSFSASAVVGDYVLFANDPQVLKEAINCVQVPSLSLKFTPAYQQAIATVGEPRFALAYINFPGLSAWISRLPLPELPEITQTLTVGLTVKEGGIAAQSALIGVAGSDRQPVLSEPVGAIAYVPPASRLVVAGTNLQKLWSDVTTGLASDSPLQQLLVRTVREIDRPLGLDFPEDIFRWVTGEFSLAFVPQPETNRLDWVFIAEKSPTSGYEDAIAHLDELAVERGYSVGALPLLDTSTTAWTKLKTATKSTDRSLASLDAEVSGLHAESDRYVILASSVEAISQSLAAGATDAATNGQTAAWQQAIAALPANNDGYVYLDWQNLAPVLEKKLPIVRVLELAAQPFFNNLRSLTLTSEGSEGNIRRSTLFLNVGV